VSGTLQGAGGIGGLLAWIRQDATQTKNFLYLYDANGNVGQLVDATDGTIVAHYEYDPFGNLLVSTGSEADSNVFRFSTKYFDAETGLYYYGYRYYDPVLGRWQTRDPIGELGGLNLYWFVANKPINKIDYLGLEEQPKRFILYEEVLSISVHGSRLGGEGTFDGRAKGTGGGIYYIAETGKELLDLMEKKSKIDERTCTCIKRMYIHSHGFGVSISMRWDSGFYITKPTSISPMGWGESDATRAKPGEARDVKDLEKLVNDRKVVFCPMCEVTFFGCHTGMEFGLAQAISEVIPCIVKGPSGNCAPVIVDGKETGEFTSDEDGWKYWGGGKFLGPPEVTKKIRGY
jgi:RHS repeat-associated protein